MCTCFPTNRCQDDLQSTQKGINYVAWQQCNANHCHISQLMQMQYKPPPWQPHAIQIASSATSCNTNRLLGNLMQYKSPPRQPHAIQFASSATSCNTNRLLSNLMQYQPLSPRPHANTSCSLVTATICDAPHATDVTSKPSSFSTIFAFNQQQINAHCQVSAIVQGTQR